MPEDTQLPQPPTPFDIGEEFGTAKKNLPPVKIVLIGVALVIVVAAIVAFVQRPQAQATGSIDDATGVEIPNQNSVMAAINVSFQNHGEKPFWIHAIRVDIDTGSGTLSDDAASPADFQRYYHAFPALKRHVLAPLEREAKIDPGGKTEGTIIVSFPITSEAFANRKSLKVTIEPYDQAVPLVMVK
jgi:hypothetical protein